MEVAESTRYESSVRNVDRIRVCKHRRQTARCLVAATLAGLLLVALQTFAVSGSTPAMQRFVFRRVEMGVEFRIEVYGCDSGAANKAATAAFDRVRKLNAIMSDYDSSSEVRRLCSEGQSRRPVTVSPDLCLVLKESVSLWRDTNGAFDVTVGPLTKLWRRARRRQEMPSPELLQAARASVGTESIQIDRCLCEITLARPDVRIDLGGIAKGYAADEALKVLREAGFPAALVDASGDLVVGDPPPGKAGWRVAIARLPAPHTSSSSEQKRSHEQLDVVLLANQAIATSGSTIQFVEINGRHFSHIVDPRTGLGLESHSMVTVIAPTGLQADSLASAVSVLGPMAGSEFVENCRPQTVQVRVQCLTPSGSRQQSESRGFKGYLITDE